MIFIRKEPHNIMDKKIIRLTEQDLHRIVKESVNEILKKSFNLKDKQNVKRKKHSAFVPNNTKYSYEELALMHPEMDFMGLGFY